MKTTLLSLLVLAALVLPISHAYAQSQAEMNQEAYADFKNQDVALNKVYQQVLAKLDDEGQAKLKTAQRAWVAFRDAQAELAADLMRGGSAAPLLRAGSLAETTRARTRQLKEYLQGL
ncbi:MAG: hypothetical protein QOE70_6749 [Chthoniobacter sp.]|jgi:uncharacterized protein YecT (DUF1311 family)|nr:hypothetical protein [Chthoniobacter sp.]